MEDNFSRFRNPHLANMQDAGCGASQPESRKHRYHTPHSSLHVGGMQVAESREIALLCFITFLTRQRVITIYYSCYDSILWHCLYG